MESSIAVFLMRQLAYEQLPTVSHHNICFHQVGRQHSVASTVCSRPDQCHMQQNNTTCTQQQYHTMASIMPLGVERERDTIEDACERQHHALQQQDGFTLLQLTNMQDLRWAEARIKITRMTLTIKRDRNWSSFQLANSAPPLSVTGSAIAPSARIAWLVETQCMPMCACS